MGVRAFVPVSLLYWLTYVWLGLLVLACVNRAPEGTFGAAVAEVGVFDYLRVSAFTGKKV